MDEGSGKRDELDERESTSVLKRGNRIRGKERREGKREMEDKQMGSIGNKRVG